MKLTRIAYRATKVASVCAPAALAGCQGQQAAPAPANLAQRASPPSLPLPPTPAQRCSSTQTYQTVIQTIRASLVQVPTLTRPITPNDFSAPMVENVNRDAMSIDCSATLYVPAPPHHSSCAAPNYSFLDQAALSGEGFTFRIQYKLHDTADNTGTQISLPQGDYIMHSMSICVD